MCGFLTKKVDQSMKDINYISPEWQFGKSRSVCGAFKVIGSIRACPVSAVLDHFPGAAIKSVILKVGVLFLLLLSHCKGVLLTLFCSKLWIRSCLLH